MLRLCATLVLTLTALLSVHEPVVSQTPLINEFMASNSATIADDDGDYSDWIEIHNTGGAAYDLTDCYLSDDDGNPLRWRFPAGSVPPQGYLLVWASGKDRVSPGGELHTNFAISAGGEPLLLTAADGITRLDEVAPVALPTDVSYGRLPDGSGNWVTFGAATPGTANDGGLMYLAAPVLSQTPGFYTGPVSVAVTAGIAEAVIRYTLDGSEPTHASAAYDQPLILTSRIGDPNTISLIPTNYGFAWNMDSWRPPRGEVFKINVLRARAFLDGHAPSAIATGSFLVDPDPAGRYPLPVISVATSPANFFANDIGIYVPGDTYAGGVWTGNFFQKGDEWERPVHIELFDNDGSILLAQDAGTRIHGGYSRYLPQKTLRMYARSSYGPSQFNCHLFPDLPHDSYKRFLIRNSGNDWARIGFRDFVFHLMCEGMGFDIMAGRPAVHFVNGEYWGVANLRERIDRHYLLRRHGVPEEEVALLSNNAELEEGLPSDAVDYLALRSFVADNDMTLPANLAHVAERMDLGNYIAYNVAQIYAANDDWPGNNIRYWRRTLPEYDPGAPCGHDGRWRWILFDADFAFHPHNHNTLALATAANGPAWPNPPWSTLLLRRLLTNESFRNSFINSFADHLNSTFKPSRLIAIADELAAIYAPVIPEWQDRYDVNYNWASGVQTVRNHANQRPAYQRQHIVSHFSLSGTTTVALDVSDPSSGRVRLNQLVIDEDLAGLDNPQQPYPWSGIYFRAIPITVTAIPSPGYRFSHWIGHGSGDPELVLVPGSAPMSLTAVFEADGEAPVPVHAWHFNNLPAGVLTEIPADLSLLGNAVITYPGTGAGYLDRVDDGTLLGGLPDVQAGYALRVRNPSDTRELVVTAPSTGHQDLVLSYAVKRTSNGAELHSLFYRLDEAAGWIAVAEEIEVAEEYGLLYHDLTGIDGIDDNPDLAFRIVFGGPGAGGGSGNQRYDNLTITAVPLPGANLPPQIAQPVDLQHAIEDGDDLVLDLNGVFEDPDNDPMSFTAASDYPDEASVQLAGSVLTITPLSRGDARITVTADDGNNDPVAHTLRVLVYPAAAVLAEGAHAFTEWDPDMPERTYPGHMLFLQSEVNDPGIDEPLLHPYYIAHDDYHANDHGTIGFPYNNTGRTRINGLGADGISFINTGRGRDLGSALLAVDTRGLASAEFSWLAGTVLPNDRIYAIRLQYRVGLDGEFEDLLIGGEPLEYMRSATPGDVQHFDPVPLPADLLGHEYLLLMWRYYHVEGASGSRAELRLDEIHITGEDASSVTEPGLPAVTLLGGNAPNPFGPATMISFSVRDGEAGRLEIFDATGRRVRSFGSRQPGHHDIRWDGTDDNGRRCAGGVYFYRLSTGEGSHTRKMLMLR